ncbi:phycoerythrobilin:ferredoxin oxidoreductase [Fragilariopsis cylindrus CCMP1102]|uniref:Phycoerythrobilin:ferredoxin oxidoreductase n=1 Tax=Fragilariopsis cylindrus CCMP1102 TaxID=635003 RepID=A0A1E7FFD1_9STRA|nr:phycoerythrobilin:ferredoxin oxidoreductase [Fragilariopsis cylindrus CCMP1102]|eukprot:OEU16878.1 phycoerythrobilin:ferredoxin oxidoreductase [Fragilariopsis cylindrus CCMP1102]
MMMTLTMIRILRGDRSNMIGRVALFVVVVVVSTFLEPVMMHVDAFAFNTCSSPFPLQLQQDTTRNNRRSRRRSCCTSVKLCAAAVSSNSDNDVLSTDDFSVGLYKKFADHAVERLLETEWVIEDESVPSNLSKKEAPTRTKESIVRITTKALIPKNNDKNKKSNSLIRYARITLLETIPIAAPASTTTADITDGVDVVTPDGIQVLNFVVLPNADTNLPVLGIDLVSLPGSKHLLLLDAQPMVAPNPHESRWKDWFKTHVIVEDKNNKDEEDKDEPLKFAWGGDFPETVKQYVSKYALWTRLQNIVPLVEKDTDDENTTTTTNNYDNDTPSITAIDVIQGDIFVAFQEHLDTYLELLEQYTTTADDDDNNIEIVSIAGDNNQPSYLDYRRNNDPAKPMLNALFGKEWTQSLLDDVLFPQD